MIGRLCLAGIMLALSVPAVGEPVPGQRYYSVQLASAPTAAALEGGLNTLGDFPYARIEKRGAQFALRIGFWTERKEAERALREIKNRFPNGFVRTAFYRSTGATALEMKATAQDAQDAQDDTAVITREPQKNVILPPAPEVSATNEANKAPPTTPGAKRRHAPDEAMLWTLLHQHRLQELQAEIDRLKRAYPGWTPSRELMKWQRIAETDAAIANAIKNQDYDATIAFAHTYPDRFGCRNPQAAWALGQAYVAMDRPKNAMQVYETFISECANTKNQNATLYNAVNMLDEQNARAFLADVQQASAAPDYRKVWAQLNYSLETRLYVAREKENKRAQIVPLSRELAPEIVQRRDADMAILLGWEAYAQNDFGTAQMWFTRALDWKNSDDARYGLALTQFKLGNWDNAESTLVPLQNDLRALKLRKDIDLARAYRAYKEKRFNESLALLDRHPELSSERDVVLLRAWDELGLGHKEEAAKLFLIAYRENPDAVAADGLVSALADNPARLSQLSAQDNGPLHARMQAATFQEYYQRKLFIAAAAYSQGQSPDLSGVDTPSIALAAAVRFKSGASGTSQLSINELPIGEAETVLGDGQEFRLDVANVNLSSGSLAPNAAVGSAQFGHGYAVTPTTRVSDAVTPFLSYQHEGLTTVFAGAGLTPTGAMPATPIGDLGVLQQLAGGELKATLFSQPVRQSMLSYTGTVDPYTGLAWGRVRDTGINAQGMWFINNSWTLTGGAQADDLTGRNVFNNEDVALNAGIFRNLKYAGFDYFTVGPDVSYQAFERNLSGFTLGQGGYYSPQGLTMLGLSTHFLTTEARSFIVKGDVSVGVFTENEHESPCDIDFPASGCLPQAPATSHSGLYYSAQFAGVYQVSQEVQIGAGIISRQTPQYRDLGAMVFARYFFGARSSVLSSDLSLQFLQQEY